MTKTVAVMVGSLREGSLNRKLALILENLAQGELRFDYLDIGALPHFNQDLWDGKTPPAPVADLKQRIEDADGLLVITPEYNRGFPGVLKNALDWASSFPASNSFAGKPTVVTGTSPGAIGSAVGQNHLRLALLDVGCVVMHHPEAYIRWSAEKYGDDGTVKDDDARQFLQDWVDAAAGWIGTMARTGQGG